MKRSIFFILSSLAIVLTGCTAPAEESVKTTDAKPAMLKNKQQPDQDLFTGVPSTQISRYATVQDGPTKAQINPLLAVSTFTFPPSIYTVGEAINQVLAPTGYRLADHLSNSVKQTLDKPLPVTDRKLGPMKIQAALETLMGSEVYQLQRDPLHRLINFTIKPSIASALGVMNDE